MFVTARAEANAIGAFRECPNVLSLLTQMMYQEAKYLLHAITRGEESTKDKHTFHVLLKMSPQDAILTILTNDEAVSLMVWLDETRAAPLADGVKAAFAATSPGRDAKTRPEEMLGILLPALTARLYAGRQLLEATDHDQGHRACSGKGAHSPRSPIPIPGRPVECQSRSAAVCTTWSSNSDPQTTS